MTNTTGSCDGKLAILSAVSVGDFEPSASTLVFHLVTETGDCFTLDFNTMIRTLLFCCDCGSLPPLSNNWIYQVAGIHGETVQTHA